MFDDDRLPLKPISDYSVGFHQLSIDYKELLEGIYLVDGFYAVPIALIEQAICDHYEGVENLQESIPPSPFELKGIEELIYQIGTFCSVNKPIWNVLDRFEWFSPHKHSLMQGYLKRSVDRFNAAQLDRAIPYTRYSSK
jgi:hypothetical protein